MTGVFCQFNVLILKTKLAFFGELANWQGVYIPLNIPIYPMSICQLNNI